MEVQFNYQQNEQSTLIEHKQNRKKEDLSLGSLAFFTNIFRDEAKVQEIIFCYW
jgi:hypothetical protein